jgi:hypothetical protein
MEVVEPISRLRIAAANQVKAERAELYQAFKNAIADDIRLTEAQAEELESRIADHARWLAENAQRLEALLPRTLLALSTYETKRDLYRNQIFSVLHESAQVSVTNLWGSRRDGARDPAVFNAVVGGVRNRLGQARGLAGQLDRCFFQIEIELLALEKRGLGLPPEPVPLAEPPPEPSTSAIRPVSKIDPRRKSHE